MRAAKRMRWALVGSLVLAFAVGGPWAAEVEKRWRVGGSFGFLNAQDEIASDSTNTLALVNRNDLQLDVFYRDPRSDSAVFNNLEIKPGPVGTFFVQYAVSKLFLVEASVGYQETKAGDVEVQVQFDGIDPPELERFLFVPYTVEAGTVERIPIQLSGLIRFRPRASFNPYLGGGIGYSVVGFSPSPEFDQLSRRLDASRGGQAIVSPSFPTAPSIFGINPNSAQDLSGAQVDAPDTFEWHVAGGAELSFKRKWAVFLDLRYTISSRSMSFGFNGGQDLGLSVPNLTDYSDAPVAQQFFGPFQITSGGLFDGGSLVPRVDAPPGTDCAVSTLNCEFSLDAPDGVLDIGYYYIQGGKVSYDAFSMQVGIRYTF